MRILPIPVLKEQNECFTKLYICQYHFLDPNILIFSRKTIVNYPQIAEKLSSKRNINQKKFAICESYQRNLQGVDVLLAYTLLVLLEVVR